MLQEAETGDGRAAPAAAAARPSRASPSGSFSKKAKTTDCASLCPLLQIHSRRYAKKRVDLVNHPAMDGATPLRRNVTAGTVSPADEATSSLSSTTSTEGESYNEIAYIDTPPSLEKGFIASSFDQGVSSTTKNTFTNTPHDRIIGKKLFASARVTPEPEGDIEPTTPTTSTTAPTDLHESLRLAQEKLSQVRISLDDALETAAGIRSVLHTSKPHTATEDDDEKWFEGIPTARHSLPVVPQSIDAERNLKLCAELILPEGSGTLVVKGDAILEG